MRKIYVPIYLIEWSDVRPYVIMAGHGIKVCSIYLWKGIYQLTVWTGICLAALWQFLQVCARLLVRAIKALCRGIWQGLLNIFTITNPRGEEEEEEEEEEDSSVQRRSIFDED
ncbi:MAG: hypothetical protein MJZ40_00390 [Bacteroidaceae bacterium]|nr:hypothetical protein [Bacteroidaceae bacterium]